MKRTLFGVILLMLCSGCMFHSANVCVQKIQQDSGALTIIDLKALVSNSPSTYPYICQSPDGQIWLYDMSDSNEVLTKYVLFRNAPPVYPEEPVTNTLEKSSYQ